MFDGHDHAVIADRGLAQLTRQGLAPSIEGVVAAGHEFFWQALEQRAAEHADARWLAVHRPRQQVELTAEVLHDTLQTKAYPKQGDVPLQDGANRAREVEVRGAAGAR